MHCGPVVLDIEGLELSSQDHEVLADPLVGMVILFSRNYRDRAQLTGLCSAIHAVRPGILIAVDHEGGRVQRFREGFTAIPEMARLGVLWEKDRAAARRAASACGYVMAAELRVCGVDLTFAPVLDLDWGRSGIIGNRAFSADPEAVTELAGAVMAGLAEAGMPSCGKHFPGHGWACADSHLALPTDERPLQALRQADLVPYRALAHRLTGVMPAHIHYTGIDEEPAGFSAFWLQKVLRGELGFQGAIFSDDLNMKGACCAGSWPERARKALAAGCDFVLACNNRPGALELLAGIRGWKPTAAFEERFARLRPSRAVPPLAGNLLYRTALADVGAL